LPGRVYILRGIGHIWSGGMTDLADELNRRGTTASAHRHSEWTELTEEAIKLYKSDPERWPIVLIGHSNGADMAINMAARMKSKGVPVALIVGYDPTR
jgi:thioesterase domain-containing protein